MLIRLLGILLLLLLFTLGCSSQDKERQKIHKILSTRSSALNSRDISQYVSIVSPHYNDKGKNFTQLKETLENSFRDFEQVSYEADSPTIIINGTTAESISSYRMKVIVRGKGVTLNGTENLRLAKEPEGWKIIAGI